MTGERGPSDSVAFQAPDWVDDIGRRFAEATGWRARFERGTAAATAGSITRLELHDGQQRLGWLALEPPDDGSGAPLAEVGSCLALIEHLVNQVARGRRASDSQAEQLKTLVDLGLKLPRSPDAAEAVNLLLTASVALTGFPAAGFFLIEQNVEVLSLRAAHLPESSTIPRTRRRLVERPPDLTALATGEIVIDAERSPDAAAWLPAGIKTAVCTAVETDAGPIGTLWAYGHESRWPGRHELQVLRSIATQVGVVLERVALVSDAERRERLRRELMLLSRQGTGEQIGVLPGDCGIEAVGRCHSRYEVGGDLCELIPVGRGRTLVAVGDACGDNIPAAMVMTAVRGALQALVGEPLDEPIHTDQLMARINRTLCGVAPEHQFMTLLLGVIDSRAMSLTYTNAGHPPPVVVRDGRPRLLDSHGMPLGISADGEYGHGVVPLRSDDLLLLFSDGLVEAMDETNEMFKVRGVVEAVLGRVDRSAEDLLQGVWDACEAHDADGQRDDRTLLVIRLLHQNAVRGPHHRRARHGATLSSR